jgi:hypothetical protein
VNPKTHYPQTTNKSQKKCNSLKGITVNPEEQKKDMIGTKGIKWKDRERENEERAGDEEVGAGLPRFALLSSRGGRRRKVDGWI